MWVDGENAPLDMSNSDDEIKEIQEARQAQAAQQQEDQGIMGASEVMKNMAPVINEGQ